MYPCGRLQPNQTETKSWGLGELLIWAGASSHVKWDILKSDSQNFPIDEEEILCSLKGGEKFLENTLLICRKEYCKIPGS